MRSFRETPVSDKSQDGGAFVVSVFLCILFCVGFVVWGLGDGGQLCEIRLASRINPNDAPVASLLRLPGIGISRASAIVAYRQDFAEQNDSRPAFESPEDLCKVRGIGPKTARNISEWLKFERGTGKEANGQVGSKQAVGAVFGDG